MKVIIDIPEDKIETNYAGETYVELPAHIYRCDILSSCGDCFERNKEFFEKELNIEKLCDEAYERGYCQGKADYEEKIDTYGTEDYKPTIEGRLVEF